jgi:hypothetical protein
MPNSESIKALQQAVEGLHNCKATFKKTFKGQNVWDGDVYLFDVTNHPTAKLACARSSPVEGRNKTRFYAVLHAPPVKFARDAVKASIANDYSKQKKPA